MKHYTGASAEADQALVASDEANLRCLHPLGFDPSRWQPIETAPKDGTTFLAYGAAPKVGGLLSPYSESADPAFGILSWYHQEYDTFEDAGGGMFRKVPQSYTGWRGGNGMRPTHWMPLPTPPEKEAVSGN